jgi:hypothetical protein
MLGAVFPVKVSLAPGLTVFSAFIAVFFTYLALISDSYTTRYLRRRLRRAARHAAKARKSEAKAAAQRNSDTTASTPNDVGIAEEADDPSQDVEAQPLLARDMIETPQGVSPEDEAENGLTNLKKALNDNSRLRAIAMDDERLEQLTWSSAGGGSTQSISAFRTAAPPDMSQPVTLRDAPALSPKPSPNTPPTSFSSRRPSLSFFSRKWSSGNKTIQSSANASSTDLTASSSDFDKTTTGEGGTSGSSNASGSFMRGLPLSRRERRRLKAGGAASTSVSELLLTLWGDCTVEAIAKAGIWASAIVTMHYSGMAAFHLEQGFAVWNKLLIAASALIAWVVCLVGLLFSE